MVNWHVLPLAALLLSAAIRLASTNNSSSAQRSTALWGAAKRQRVSRSFSRALPRLVASWAAVAPNLSTAVCSITPTQRRRYFWAAWWTGQPRYSPFRRPDAANGGARTFEEALNEAQAVAGRTLSITDAYWARAWKSVLRGQDPGPPPTAAAERPGSAARSPAAQTAHGVSAWAVLGLSPGASLSELKRAFQRRALETHPDRGGAAEEFQQVHRAYEKLRERLEHRAARPSRRR